MDEKIRAEFFSRRFSLMQGTILGQIDKELDDDVFVKLITAYFHTVRRLSQVSSRNRLMSWSKMSWLLRYPSAIMS